MSFSKSLAFVIIGILAVFLLIIAIILFPSFEEILVIMLLVGGFVSAPTLISFKFFAKFFGIDKRYHIFVIIGIALAVLASLGYTILLFTDTVDSLAYKLLVKINVTEIKGMLSESDVMFLINLVPIGMVFGFLGIFLLLDSFEKSIPKKLPPYSFAIVLIASALIIPLSSYAISMGKENGRINTEYVYLFLPVIILGCISLTWVACVSSINAIVSGKRDSSLEFAISAILFSLSSIVVIPILAVIAVISMYALLFIIAIVIFIIVVLASSTRTVVIEK